MHKIRMLALTTRLGAVIASSSLVFFTAGSVAAHPQPRAHDDGANGAFHVWASGFLAGFVSNVDEAQDEDVDKADNDAHEDDQGQDEDVDKADDPDHGTESQDADAEQGEDNDEQGDDDDQGDDEESKDDGSGHSDEDDGGGHDGGGSDEGEHESDDDESGGDNED